MRIDVSASELLPRQDGESHIAHLMRCTIYFTALKRGMTVAEYQRVFLDAFKRAYPDARMVDGKLVTVAQ